MTECEVIDFCHRVEKLSEETFLRKNKLYYSLIFEIYVNEVIKKDEEHVRINLQSKVESMFQSKYSGVVEQMWSLLSF